LVDSFGIISFNRRKFVEWHLPKISPLVNRQILRLCVCFYYKNMLNSFFLPKSIAVIGASAEPGKLGNAVLKNLVDSGYAEQHPVYPINPKATTILGVTAYASLAAVPGPIELAVVVIPYQGVPNALRECASLQVPAVIVISAGFREAGRDGVERERELGEILHAQKGAMRLIGPNCLGIIDTHSLVNASFAAGTPPKGPMAFMSQSGALGTAVLDWAMAGQLGLSKFVSLGNKADVNEIDLLLAWADDPNINVILIYCEELNDGSRFIDVARQVSKKKPIVAIKSGVTQSGSRAVSSHTGSLAGSEQAYQAAFLQAGVLRADSMQELFDQSLAFAYQPALRGNNIVIVTNAGGPGILATDALERAGLNLAKLDMKNRVAMDAFLPSSASSANPVDVLGDARADRYQLAMKMAIEDPNVDGMLVILTPQAMTEIAETAQAVVELQKNTDKPILACFMGEAKASVGVQILTANHVPNYPFPERAAGVFRAMATYRDIQKRPLPVFEKFKVDTQVVKNLFKQVRDSGRVTIGDSEAQKVLEAYGFRVPKSALAKNADEAVYLAERIGYPVVLKIASPDILHKTDIGGVKVGLQNADQLRDAFELMIYRTQRYLPEARIWGCQVQEMAPSGGLEVLLGMNRDPQFGPLVTFGLGGIYVEVLKDVTFRIAPFSAQQAREMLQEIRARALLDGVRGKPAVDKEILVESLLRIGQLVQDFPEITELDINPLLVYPKGAIAIDMRLVLKA
jgi:acetyl coenzyme A synthetase (ADP forming)-like protein